MTAGNIFAEPSTLGRKACACLQCPHGVIKCRIITQLCRGFATTRAKLVCKGKHGVIRDSQLPSALSAEKLKELERGPIKEDLSAVPEPPKEPPVFIEKLTSVGVSEGEPIHLEARVEPKTDSSMQITWMHNGKELKSGSRFKSNYDFGYVSLDILYSYPEDR